MIATGGRGEGGTERGVRMRSAWINMSNDKESARPSPQGFARAGSTHHENTISFINSTGDAFQDTCPDGDDVCCCPGQGLKLRGSTEDRSICANKTRLQLTSSSSPPRRSFPRVKPRMLTAWLIELAAPRQLWLRLAHHVSGAGSPSRLRGCLMTPPRARFSSSLYILAQREPLGPRGPCGPTSPGTPAGPRGP